MKDSIYMKNYWLIGRASNIQNLGSSVVIIKNRLSNKENYYFFYLP